MTITRDVRLACKFCSNHAVLLGSLDDDVSEPILFRRPAGQPVIHIHPDAYHTDSKPAPHAAWEDRNLLVSETKAQGTLNLPQPRRIGKDWIDLDLLKAWMHKCEYEHGETCGMQDHDAKSLPVPLLLVDTHQNCLTYVGTQVQYVTLSYVWGQTNAFLTTMSNISELLRPGALHNRRTVLPRTISHAIDLTRALDERYLWVDALCIVQDAADKMNHLDAMASLFANSCLTIVAATGAHANSGLKGLPGISESRCATQCTAELLPYRHLIKPHARHIWDDSHLQPWSTRAWTFQEAICSPRLLYLAHDTVRWVCKQRRWSEESTSMDCTKDYATFEQRRLDLASPRLSSSILPCFGELLSLINGYNVRKLTYWEDALTAFAGVASRLSRKFMGGLLCGLPAFFFDLFLLWRPARRLGPAKARANRVQESTVPSWSWAAYETEITLPYTWMRHEDQSGPTPVTIGRIRPFYIVSIQYGDTIASRHDISCSWSDYARNALDNPCLPGWRSHRYPFQKDAALFGELEEAPYFTHDTDEESQFWFPVPLVSDLTLTGEQYCPNFGDDTISSLAPPSNPRYLFFKTQSGHFRLGRTQRAATQILTKSGEVAGTLYLHEELQPYSVAAGLNLDISETIELIAILGNTIPNEDFDVWLDETMNLQKACDRSRHVHRDKRLHRARDVYNVMWINRICGICYRKATGVVDRDIWEGQVVDKTEVVLG